MAFLVGYMYIVGLAPSGESDPQAAAETSSTDSFELGRSRKRKLTGAVPVVDMSISCFMMVYIYIYIFFFFFEKTSLMSKHLKTSHASSYVYM